MHPFSGWGTEKAPRASRRKKGLTATGIAAVLHCVPSWLRAVGRYKADGGEPANTSYIKNPNLIHPSIQGRNSDYLPTGGEYFSIIESKYDEEEHWLEYDMECIKSCPYEMILSSSSPFGLFIETTADYWIEEVQFYKEVYGNTGYSDEVVRIDPGKINL